MTTFIKTFCVFILLLINTITANAQVSINIKLLNRKKDTIWAPKSDNNKERIINISRHEGDTLFCEWKRIESKSTFLQSDSIWMYEPNENLTTKKNISITLNSPYNIGTFKYFVMSNGIIKYVFERKKFRKNIFYLKKRLLFHRHLSLKLRVFK